MCSQGYLETYKVALIHLNAKLKTKVTKTVKTCLWWTWNPSLIWREKKKMWDGGTGICLSHLCNCTSEASCLCDYSCPGGIGSGRITVLRPNSWEWPLALTRHAVPMTNTHRATVTCVSHPCESSPPPPTHTQTHTYTQSCTVYLMNSTLGAAGVFAGTVKGEKWPPMTSEGHLR